MMEEETAMSQVDVLISEYLVQKAVVLIIETRAPLLNSVVNVSNNLDGQHANIRWSGSRVDVGSHLDCIGRRKVLGKISKVSVLIPEDLIKERL